MSTIKTLNINDTKKYNSVYTIQETDVDKGSLTNTFSLTNEKIFIEQNSAAIPVVSSIKIPKTQEEFKSLSWAQIKNLADYCAQGNEDEFQFIMDMDEPFYKEVETEYGTVKCRLKALNNKEKTSGGLAGFTFESEEILTMFKHDEIGSFDIGGVYVKNWNGSKIRELLNNTVYQELPQDLKNVIVEVNNICSLGETDPELDTNTEIIIDKCWIPSYIEIFGAQSYDTVNPTPEEGTQFDWYIKHNNKEDRIKKIILDSSTTDWTLRTPHHHFLDYFFMGVSKDGISRSNFSTTACGVILCFCI